MHSTPEKEKPPGLLLHISNSSLFFCFATKALLPTAAGQNHAQATSRTVHKCLPSIQHVVKEQTRRPCTADLPHFIVQNRALPSISVVYHTITFHRHFRKGLRITLGRYAMDSGCNLSTKLHGVTTRQTVILYIQQRRTSNLKCLQKNVLDAFAKLR